LNNKFKKLKLLAIYKEANELLYNALSFQSFYHDLFKEKPKKVRTEENFDYLYIIYFT